MMTYVLILYIYAGPFSKGDSVALEKIDGYSSLESCQKAGIAGDRLVEDSLKKYHFVCIPKE